jgi:hypothetical protein
MVPHPLDLSKSLEQLEGRRWPDPPEETTSLVKAIHELRRRPIGTLESHELARLIAQKEGVPLLLPLAVKILSESARAQAEGEYFFDDELLYAMVIVDPRVWQGMPEIARELKIAVLTLKDFSRYLKPDVERFLSSLPEES